EIDPLEGFGSPELRKAVEEAAVAATTANLRRLGFDCVSREKDNIGYDIEATRQIDGETLHIEVKGTSGPTPRFFMTANEYGYREAPEWRLAIVTDALGKRDVAIYTAEQFATTFEMAPIVWKGVKRNTA